MPLTLGLIVSAVCLFIAFRSVPLSALLESLRSANYAWIFLYPVLCVALNLVRGEVWTILLKRQSKLTPAFWAYTVGFLFNNVLPLRVGEAARVVVLAKHARVPTAEVAATAGLERILDLAGVLIVLACALPFVGVSRGAAVRYGVLLSLAALVASVAGVCILAKWGAALEPTVDRLVSVISPNLSRSIVTRWHQVIEGSSRLLRPSIGLPAFGGILVVWALTIVAQWSVLRAFQPEASFIQAAFMVAIVSLAIAVPAAPGFIGVYQWAGQQALAAAFPHLYSATSALAIAVVAHGVSYVCSTALGVIGLWYFGVSFKLLETQLD